MSITEEQFTQGMWEAPINYCPVHGDLLNRPGDGADARSWRCHEAHNIEEIRAGFRHSEVPETSEKGE